MQIKPLIDEYGVIAEAFKILPTEYYKDFLKSIAELENNECYKNDQFPHTRLHKVKGLKQYTVLRADIDKTSGWRLHVQYGKDSYLHLKDIIEGQKHDDDLIDAIENKKERYFKKKK